MKKLASLFSFFKVKKKILPSKPCEFCKNELTYSHTENNELLTIYVCNNCPILIFYYFTPEMNIARTCFTFDKNGGRYFWTNNYIEKTSYIIGLSESPHRDVREHIVDFPKIMDINPTNIYNKFSLWMTFS